MVFQKTLIIFVLFFCHSLYAGWVVDCSNYCFFNDIQPNCQGVYWQYPDGKGYSAWNASQNACLEVDNESLTTHIIRPSQITCSCPTPTTTPPSDKSAALTSATRTKLELLRAQVQGWTMCGPGTDVTDPNDVFTPFDHWKTASCQLLRQNSQPRTYLNPNECFFGLSAGGAPWACGFHGDQLAGTGASCLTGNEDLCDQIRDAQDPSTGAWYRNGYIRRHPEVTGGMPSFSRDQLTGILGYWIKRKDKASLVKWLNFVKSNGSAPWAGGFIPMSNLCPVRPNIPKPANLTQADWDAQLPDDRCAIIPESWGLIYYAALSAGLTTNELQNIDSRIYNSLVGGSSLVDIGIIGAAGTVPAVAPGAYQIADIWDALNIRLASGGSSSQLRSTAQLINSRTGKLNPLYHYLAEGKATEYGAYLIRKYCTAAKPTWGYWFSSGYDGAPTNTTGYWIHGKSFLYGNYQYAGGKGPYGDTGVPNGHDCLTYLNQILENSDLTQLECEAGDQLINGACLKYALPKPTVAPVFGIDYKVEGSGRIHYMAIDQKSCDYGGTLNTSGWPTRCDVSTSLKPGMLHPGTNYWVDPSQAIPGVYYAKVSNACPYGGQPSGNNCKLVSFTPPTLLSGVSYWVDVNPAGVYYAQSGGRCLNGGSPVGSNCLLLSLSNAGLVSSTAYFTRSNFAHPGVYYYPRVIPEKRFCIRALSLPMKIFSKFQKSEALVEEAPSSLRAINMGCL